MRNHQKTESMSISVKNITKIYGEQRALDNLSFEVGSGEIVGFLGPNGAGKSTMMKIITCFIPPTEGEVKVNGYDIFDDSMNVKRCIGYLPENNPLYFEMYVKEYLEFIAGLHKIGGNVNARVDEIVELTGLTLEYRKKIGALSKGYRQRVGLAQALIHNPDVLILDEPTSGLDPNQLVEIRELIKTIGKEKTIMLSTHIMQEVEAICNRVIIINKGKLIANDLIGNLHQITINKQSILIEVEKSVTKDSWFALTGIVEAEDLGGNKWRLIAESPNDIRPMVFNFAVSNSITILSIVLEEQSLEKTFQTLTKNR